MKDPKDFPKALWAISIAEVIVFTLCGAIMYHYVGRSCSLASSPDLLTSRAPAGNQYITAPAFGSLTPEFKKIAFSFAIPTIVYLGSLYSVRCITGSSRPSLRADMMAVCISPFHVLQALPRL